MSTNVRFGLRTMRIDVGRLTETDNPVINGIKEMLCKKINGVSNPYVKCKGAVDESLDHIPSFLDKTKEYKEKIKKLAENTAKENDETPQVSFFNIPGHFQGLFTRMANNRMASNNCHEYFVEINLAFNVLDNSLKSINNHIKDIMYRCDLLGKALHYSFPDLQQEHQYTDQQKLGWAYFYLLEVNSSESQSLSSSERDVLAITKNLLQGNPDIKSIFDNLYAGAGRLFEFFAEVLVYLATAAKDIVLYIPTAAVNFIVSVSCSGTQYLHKLDEIVIKTTDVEHLLKKVKYKLTSKDWN